MVSQPTLPFGAPHQALPWRRSLLVVLALHLLGAVLFWQWQNRQAPTAMPTPAVMMVFAEAPQAAPADSTPPGQAMPQPEPEPSALPEPLPLPQLPESSQPRIALPPVKKKEPKPIEKTRRIAQPKPPQEAVKSHPPALEQNAGAPPPGNANRTVAPQTQLTPYSQAGEDSWRSRINSRLNRFKRYPKDALRLKRQGIGRVNFTLDLQGNVLAVSLVSSAGLPSLDREIIALVKRASPLPTPPADTFHNGVVELTMPIDFSLHNARF